MAALTVIVEEAGGTWTDVAGVNSLEGGSLVCTNGILHDEVLSRLTAPAPG
jgi:histidinol-phosphatase